MQFLTTALSLLSLSSAALGWYVPSYFPGLP